ncbi:glutamate receptor ionotropic, kainate glr-3-like [Dermacentor andersoni]|uniref:glutamate receptor ionotropic, kainate glr-3-like n=1 Tax=Dermacentor andersoni TaxID=34620 RepID=UPI002417DE49|nr:glutamate receptor ionotropic, delta-1-like [Dermacentor andersoni]
MPALQWPPYVIYVKDEYGQDRVWGISGALMGNMTESMGLRYVVKKPADNQWGYRMANGSWAGMLGDLHRNESELAVGPFVITSGTASHFPNGYIYMIDTFNFMSGIEHPFATEIFTRISAFDIQMWALMFAYMILLAFLSLRLLSANEQRRSTAGFLERFDKWNDMLFLYFSGLMQRASSHRDGSNTSALFHGLLWLWLVCSFFVMNFFTANMSASLMVKTEAPRIRTVADVLRTPDKRILLFADSGFTDLLMYSDLESYRAVYSQIMRTGGEVRPADVFLQSNMRRVLKQDVVILQERLTLDDQVGRQCSSLVGHGFFYFSDEYLATLMIGWYARADFDPVLKDEFDIRLKWFVESGLLQRFRQEISPIGEECMLRMSDKADMQHRALLFDDLKPLFLLLLLLLKAAAVVFVIELLVATANRRRARPRRHCTSQTATGSYSAGSLEQTAQTA